MSVEDPPRGPPADRSMNIALITLDSLRYDVACAAHTPQLDTMLDVADAGRWRATFCNGDYTLPSHVSMLQGGRLPSNRGDEPIYNHDLQSAFRIEVPWIQPKKTLYPLPHAPNLVQAFASLGYRTVGIGGVGWFDTRCQTTSFWKEHYFAEFEWRVEFKPQNPDSFEAQIDAVEGLDLADGRPLFFFQNISTPHTPYRGKGLSRVLEEDLRNQAACLEYVDLHLPRLIRQLPRPCHVFLLADHGECFGEDGMWGHAIAHPKVHEVPLVHWVLR